jgi:hypothetical protein
MIKYQLQLLYFSLEVYDEIPKFHLSKKIIIQTKQDKINFLLMSP